MITAAEIQNEISTGVAYLKAGDYSNALIALVAAQALMAAVMDIKTLESEITWSAEQLDSSIERVRRLERRQAGASGGRITQQPIELDRLGGNR